MSSSSKMVLISLFLFFSVTIFAKIGVSQVGCQVRSRCSEQGPLIRFPFWLKDQPHSCGYPSFELACVEKKQTVLTMLELPNSVKLLVLGTSNGSDNELNGIENHVILGQRIGISELWNYSNSIICGFFWAL
ncbi:hypothetical protein VitviT2T_025411 [Vitis vinifera]|uniref:RING-type E3 ubiquitin transferase n=1 Tax=Vitis vinifera TaxID=29760 RepID=A0ABY9DKR2_VITVI|nr:hypothetical protein VitviT2T_025411 [Vitis vinifera]